MYVYTKINAHLPIRGQIHPVPTPETRHCNMGIYNVNIYDSRYVVNMKNVKAWLFFTRVKTTYMTYNIYSWKYFPFV